MRPILPVVLVFLICLFPSILFAFGDGDENQEKYGLKIKKATDQIRLDGKLEEATWKQADVGSNFTQKNPVPGAEAVLKTQFQLTYDDNFLYVAATCFDESTNHIVSTMKRDIGFWDGDNVGVVLDPLNEATTGFMFGTNPAGVQTDVLLGGGTGPEHYGSEWDNRWYVETHVYHDRWTIEMAIPFKTLRYETGRTTWGINFFRNDMKNNRQDVWAAIPRQFWFIDLGYTGRLDWDVAPRKTNGNISVIPYINANTNKNFQEGGETNNGFDVGVDAKIALTPSLNLDLTVNPDFSQVEVDQQVTNLTRFSIFLPERRTFFIENSDIFSRFGIPPVRPFFSRRIGLDGNGQAVPIAYGARLTGNVTNSTRIGIMNVHSKSNDNQAGQNYTAAAFNQRVFGRSTIRGLFVNRQSFAEGEFVDNDYNRNASLEFTYSSNNGVWQGWSGYHKSFKPNISGDNTFTSIGGAYNGEVLEAVVDWTRVGTEYFADVGFVNFVNNYDALRDTSIRLGFNNIFLPVTFTILPENSPNINRHQLGVESYLRLDPEYKFVEKGHEFGYNVEFKNSSSAGVELSNNGTDLRFPFSFTGGEPLPVGRYNWNRAGIFYNSDESKKLLYSVGFATGGFYNGNLRQVEVGLEYRQQPWGLFGLDIEYNQLDFPDEFGQETIWAFSPKIE
ncbi:MAG: DUF5916 domain-containing protein, partial [Bacteroidota bacterium]